MESKKALAVLASSLLLAAGSAKADDASDLRAKFDALQKQLDAVKAQLDQVTAEMNKKKEAEAQQAAERCAVPPAEAG